MAIIFPEHCKGVTLGALRQAARDGYSSACGGLHSVACVKHAAQTPQLYFEKTEPAGLFMSNLEKTNIQITEASEAIFSAGQKLVETANDANKKLATVTGKFRDGTERLAVAIDKMTKIAERGDFAETVRLTESLVSSLERLAVLEEKGLLEKVMKAMK